MHCALICECARYDDAIMSRLTLLPASCNAEIAAAADPKAIQWCATKFTGGEEIRNAAKLICEYAQQKASA